MIRRNAAFAAAFVLAACLGPGVAHAAQATFLTPGGRGAPIAGTVEWSTARGAAGGTTFVGHATFPDASVTLDLSMSRNTDKSMPASHILDVTLTPAANFGGKPVAQIGPLSLRKSPGSKQAAPLVGVTARVQGDAFLVALSAAPQDVRRNLVLLAKPGWLDLGVTYAKGARADIVLELDQAGQEAMRRLLNSGG